MNINDQLKQIPEWALEQIADEHNPDINEEILDQFQVSESQMGSVLETLLKVFTKQIAVLDFPLALSKLNLGSVDTRGLALEFALRRLWPLQTYLGDVDRLILRLGGRVPAKVAPTHTDSQSTDTIATASEYLSGNSERQNYHLTKEFIRDENGGLVEPSVQNWLKDYLHYAGAVQSDSLKRSEYLIKSPNARSLTDDEKQNILNFFVSYADQERMRFILGDDEMLSVQSLREPVVDGKKTTPRTALGNNIQELVSQYDQYVASLQTTVERESEILAVEVEKNANRLADIFWNALALNERDRALTSLMMMSEKKLLPEILRTDQRFIGIVRRHISVRFGEKARTVWSPENVTLIYYVLFFNLVLTEKLSLTPTEAAMTAHYAAQILGLQDKPSYIDIASGYWRFRQVKFNGVHFTLAEE